MTTHPLPEGTHPGWYELIRRTARHQISRRAFLPGAAAAMAGLAGGRLLAGNALIPPANAATLPDLANWASTNKIKHVIILVQENRSFDHYFGAFAATLGQPAHPAAGFRPNALAYPDAAGKLYHPTHLEDFCDADPDHTWEGSHAKWNNGAMDGWVTAEGGLDTAIGYYEPADHIYHVSLAHQFTLSDHHFCAQIGPTLPNRLYLWSGTSGWDYLTPTGTSDSLPFNNPSLVAVPPILTWPTMPDVLSAANLPWKCYSVADGSIPSAIGAFNPLIFFESILTNPAKLLAATAPMHEFFTDLALGTLPAVSWIVTEAVVSEHPPAPPDMGQLLAARVVQEVMASSAWASTALFITYDEGGGYFEHVAPKILEQVPATLPDPNLAVGPGFRVPLFVVSPYARQNTIFSQTTDHTSILQFIEQTFSVGETKVELPTIAPERRKLAELRLAFDFTQDPIQPALPSAASLYARAHQTVLLLNLKRTLASCGSTIPTWLPPLLGV